MKMHPMATRDLEHEREVLQREVSRLSGRDVDRVAPGPTPGQRRRRKRKNKQAAAARKRNR